LRQPFEGQKRFKGVIVGTEASDIVLRLNDEEEIVLPFQAIERANVQMPERAVRSRESE
jgi:ribosome maturation factor RimP